MRDTFLYSGLGKAVRGVTAVTGNVVSDPEVTTIPDNGYSETFGARSGKELMFHFVFGAAATGSVLIQRCPTAAAAASELHDTLTVTAANCVSWSAGEPLLGFYRFQNTSGQTVVAHVNHRI
jgi:hypothetical protein